MITSVEMTLEGEPSGLLTLFRPENNDVIMSSLLLLKIINVDIVEIQ